MTPAHSNKDGVRYRYYVSHPVLQRRKQDTGTVARVPAAPIERLVVDAVRARTPLCLERGADLSNREVVERFVAGVVIHPNAVDVKLQEAPQTLAADENPPLPVTDVRACDAPAASPGSGTVISLPWSTPAFLSVKGVLHQPDAMPILRPQTRDAILLAIAKARCWIADLASGRVRSFAEIAQREGKVERHIRLLTPLAFTPPQTLAAIIAGTGPSDLTITALSHTIPWAWP
jgi:site-specific DNA recombinase